MELDLPNSLAVLKNARTEDLYIKLLDQIRKDLSLANIQIEIPNDIRPEALVALLREEIYRILMEQFPKNLNLLYVADIPEIEIAKLDGMDAVDMAQQICYLVLKRLWKKVWYRERLS